MAEHLVQGSLRCLRVRSLQEKADRVRRRQHEGSSERTESRKMAAKMEEKGSKGACIVAYN